MGFREWFKGISKGGQSIDIQERAPEKNAGDAVGAGSHQQTIIDCLGELMESAMMSECYALAVIPMLAPDTAANPKARSPWTVGMCLGRYGVLEAYMSMVQFTEMQMNMLEMLCVTAPLSKRRLFMEMRAALQPRLEMVRMATPHMIRELSQP
jgi:hypothetical protein